MIERIERRIAKIKKKAERNAKRFAFDLTDKKSYSFPFLKRCGIYAIECIQCKRIYIGQSIFIGRRICDHLHQLSEGIHPNNDFSLDYEIYGPMGFRVYVICKCTKKQLDTAERIAINQAKRQGYVLYNK